MLKKFNHESLTYMSEVLKTNSHRAVVNDARTYCVAQKCAEEFNFWIDTKHWPKKRSEMSYENFCKLYHVKFVPPSIFQDHDN